MSHYTEVKCRKKPRKEKVLEILNELNSTHFKGIYTINKWEEDDGEWGYSLEPKEKLNECQSLFIDLEKWTFTLRRGIGGFLMWWVNDVVANELSVVFNGKIVTGGEPKEPVKYPTFKDFLMEEKYMNRELSKRTYKEQYAFLTRFGFHSGVLETFYQE